MSKFHSGSTVVFEQRIKMIYNQFPCGHYLLNCKPVPLDKLSIPIILSFFIYKVGTTQAEALFSLQSKDFKILAQNVKHRERLTNGSYYVSFYELRLNSFWSHNISD